MQDLGKNSTIQIGKIEKKLGSPLTFMENIASIGQAIEEYPTKNPKQTLASIRR
ncbi:hypothetical protein J4G07_03230 [Candidatus Poribacteria bacterium]|nr:hypothetical protein [Candidatus Poribacteria bacterium]